MATKKKATRKPTKKASKTAKKMKSKAKPKTPKKKGRPKGATSVFTSEIKAAIVASLRLGLSYRESAEYNKVSESGLREARQEDAAFSAQCQAARIDSKAHSLAVVRKSSDAGVHLRFLEYLRRFEDGEKITHTHQGPDGGPIKTESLHKREDLEGLTKAELKTMKAMLAKGKAKKD